MIFRQLQRKNQELTVNECAGLLKSTKRGVLSVIGDEGYPYGMPMNHLYSDDGNIYFHCGRSGHRLDSLRNCDKVSFCVCDDGAVTENKKWALTFKSVIVFGRTEVIDDINVVSDISERLCRKFTDDDSYIKSEIEQFAHETLILRLTPEHICGKKVVEE